MNEETNISFQSLDASLLKKKKIGENDVFSEQISPTAIHPDWPKVELISKEGKLKTIKVTCDCGKETHLNCEY